MNDTDSKYSIVQDSPPRMTYALLRFAPMVLFLVAAQSCASMSAPCSDDWYVTGYYTPHETDYNGGRDSVIIDRSMKTDFPESFLKDVKLEGWGKTRFGWYLGYYSSRWHQSDQPLDSRGRALVLGTAAIDPKVVAQGSTVTIQSDHPFLKSRDFTASDVGQMINNKHIDIYAGEGLSARNTTLALTGESTVCISQ